MKALLINPSSKIVAANPKYRRKFLTPILPLGIAYIASVLEKNGIEVSVIDQVANNMTNKEVLKEIGTYMPQIIGFSCLTPVMNNVKDLVCEIRANNKNIKIVLGNIHATIFANDLLAQGIADIIVRGEGESSMLEVVLSIKDNKNLHNIKGISYIEDGKIYHNQEREPIEDIDNLPYPALHLFDLKLYKEVPLAGIYDELALSILGSRGCPYRCYFCSQDKIHKTSRYRKIQKIVDEIEFIFGKYKVKYFGFADPFFPPSIESGLEFCNELILRGLHKKIRWVTETRVDKVNSKLLKKMKEANMHLIMYGFEVGNQRILDSLNKKTTLEQARKAMAETKKAGILTLGLFMLGMPGETKKTCEETIKFAKEIDCDIAKFNIAVPLPGSQFFTEYKEKLDIDRESEKFTSWYDWFSSSGDLIYVPEGMSSEELKNLQRKAMFKFYVRPRIIIRYIAKGIISPKNLCFGIYILIVGYLRILFTQFKR